MTAHTDMGAVVRRLVTDAVMEIAAEHLAWEISQGHTVAEIFACLKLPMPQGATWEDALCAIAWAYDLGAEIRARQERWLNTGKPYRPRAAA